MAEPGRAALRLRHRRPAPTLRPPQRPSTREGPARVGQGVEREPEAVSVDQNRRPDPRITRTTSSTIYWRRTLVAPRGMAPRCSENPSPLTDKRGGRSACRALLAGSGSVGGLEGVDDGLGDAAAGGDPVAVLSGPCVNCGNLITSRGGGR